MRRSYLLAFALLVLGCGNDAAAQGFVSPFLGTTLSSPSSIGSATKPGFGVAVGGIGGIIGGEAEIAYYPELLDNGANAIAKNKVITYSGNVLLGPMIGPVKVYGAAGAGSLYLSVTSLSSVVIPNASNISKYYFTFNAGAGVMGFFSSHFGVRGDLRYYRAFGVKADDLENSGLALDHFDFWRGAVGLAVTF
jgi:hypothetical protein